MTPEQTLIPLPQGDATLSALVESARGYLAQAKAGNTVKAYRSDWAHFEVWCRCRCLPALAAHPETVALYITALADQGKKVATISRRLAAISKAHQSAGYESPASLKHAAVSEVWKGIRRAKGTAPSQKAAATTDKLRSMLDAIPEGLGGTRDRALLLLGFAAALRRSELVALVCADLAVGSEGLTVTLRRSKTDQDGEGRKIGVPYGSNPGTCPVRAVQAWLEASGVSDGPLFRAVTRHGHLGSCLSDKAVALVVKRYAEAAGLHSEDFSGHSLRSGLATSAAIAGVSERAIMNQTGHKSTAMVRRYIRDGSLFRENAAARVGL